MSTGHSSSDVARLLQRVTTADPTGSHSKQRRRRRSDSTTSQDSSGLAREHATSGPSSPRKTKRSQERRRRSNSITSLEDNTDLSIGPANATGKDHDLHQTMPTSNSARPLLSVSAARRIYGHKRNDSVSSWAEDAGDYEVRGVSQDDMDNQDEGVVVQRDSQLVPNTTSTDTARGRPAEKVGDGDAGSRGGKIAPPERGGAADNSGEKRSGALLAEETRNHQRKKRKKKKLLSAEHDRGGDTGTLNDGGRGSSSVAPLLSYPRPRESKISARREASCERHSDGVLEMAHVERAAATASAAASTRTKDTDVDGVERQLAAEIHSGRTDRSGSMINRVANRGVGAAAKSGSSTDAAIGKDMGEGGDDAIGGARRHNRSRDGDVGAGEVDRRCPAGRLPRKYLELRKTLPIFSHKAAIIRAVKDYQVTNG